jgi:uncharacterized membrane protein SpoIIM required for sporulation
MADPNPPSKPVLQLKSQKFREAREGDWRALNSALDRAERQGLSGFSIDELLNLPVLYRSAMSSLSMAKSISLDRNMVSYLQSLSARAYVYIYGPHSRLKDVLAEFFGKSWPQSVRRLTAELWLAFVAMTAGILIGWLLCASDSSWYDVFVPATQAGGRDLSASAQALRETLGAGPKDTALSPFAVFLMTHNTQVSIMAFALGAIFGLPTLMVLIQNGIGLGAMLWLFARKGLGFEFGAWLTIHGTTELFAIVIAGACGFHIGRRLMFPGEATRMVSLSQAGRLTGTVMIGVALMLTVAGCLEGIGRQTITDSLARIAIGAVMLVLWLAYFFMIGKKARIDG